jgi:hypothetical protein
VTYYTVVGKDELNYEFVEKCRSYAIQIANECNRHPSFNSEDIKICRESWVLDTVYIIVTTIGEIAFCVETGGLIDYKSKWYTSGEMANFLEEHLTGFYALPDHFQKKDCGKFEDVVDWAKSHGIQNYGRFVPDNEQVADLLENFDIIDEEELRKEIYKLSILGYNCAFSNIFDDADEKCWRYEYWDKVLIDKDEEIEIYIDVSDLV